MGREIRCKWRRRAIPASATVKACDSWCWRAWDWDVFRASTCSADMERGNVIAVLRDYNPGDRGLVHAVFVGPGQHVPARVRVMLDYLLEKVKLGDD